jgi:hypothetical protein
VTFSGADALYGFQDPQFYGSSVFGGIPMGNIYATVSHVFLLSARTHCPLCIVDKKTKQ